MSQLSHRHNRGIITGMLLFCLMAVAACGGSGGGGGTSSGNGGSSTSSGPAATATPKPTLHLQEITVAYCTSLMSVAEANQIIPSSAPATYITQGNPNDAESSACNYNISASQFLVIVYFIPYSGPDPIPQSDIQAELAKTSGASITINKTDQLSGIGDQAAYVELTANENGENLQAHVIYILEGSFIFDCVTYSFLSPALATEDQLKQCATLVDSRLRA